jgi:hypothetical protein
MSLSSVITQLREVSGGRRRLMIDVFIRNIDDRIGDAQAKAVITATGGCAG